MMETLQSVIDLLLLEPGQKLPSRAAPKQSYVPDLEPEVPMGEADDDVATAAEEMTLLPPLGGADEVRRRVGRRRGIPMHAVHGRRQHDVVGPPPRRRGRQRLAPVVHELRHDLRLREDRVDAAAGERNGPREIAPWPPG